MKQLLKAWKAYREKDKTEIWATTSDGVIRVSSGSQPSFEGFMDYLVNKESKRKKK